MRQDLLRQICLPPIATILDAVESLNKSRKGIVLVVAPDRRLLGTITDADVRHGLALRISLEEPITTIANGNAVTLVDGTSHDEIVSCFVENKTACHSYPRQRGYRCRLRLCGPSHSACANSTLTDDHGWWFWKKNGSPD